MLGRVTNIGPCNGPTPHRIGVAAVSQFLCVSRYMEQAREEEKEREKDGPRENTASAMVRCDARYDALFPRACSRKRALHEHFVSMH